MTEENKKAKLVLIEGKGGTEDNKGQEEETEVDQDRVDEIVKRIEKSGASIQAVFPNIQISEAEEIDPSELD